MTVQEIRKEVFDDFKNLKGKLIEYKKKFEKSVLKGCHKYPLSKSFEFKTREKKNLFIVTYTALKRSDWKKPVLSVYSIYIRPEGNYAVSLSLDMKIISIHPPHFFKRYRERIVKDEFSSNEDIIRQYFKNDWGFVGVVVNKDFESIYYSFENDDKKDKVSFVAATSQGYCFAEKQGDVNIIKTIISEEMLFENQKFLFSELKNEFKRANAERYGTNI
jgi:hypothetical protein